jgi:hypothetical protein
MFSPFDRRTGGMVQIDTYAEWIEMDVPEVRLWTVALLVHSFLP